MTTYLGRQGLTLTDVSGWRLGVVNDPAPGHEQVRGRMAIPYLDRFSEPLGFKFRCLEPHVCKDHGCPKYLGVTGERGRLFNAPTAILGDPLLDTLPPPDIHVAEGEVETIALTAIGLNAVGLPGANAWRPHHTRMLQQFETVYLWGDPDDAGRAFNNTIRKHLAQSRIVPMRDGDVCETLADGGPDALYALLAAA